MIKMKTYRLTLKHDTGKIRIKTTAENKETAINIIMQFENCPRSAIVKIEHLKTPLKI